jgi:hypothetical protein
VPLFSLVFTGKRFLQWRHGRGTTSVCISAFRRRIPAFKSLRFLLVQHLLLHATSSLLHATSSFVHELSYLFELHMADFFLGFDLNEPALEDDDDNGGFDLNETASEDDDGSDGFDFNEPKDDDGNSAFDLDEPEDDNDNGGLFDLDEP